MSPVVRAEIVVDLAAIRHNVRLLRELSAPAQMMTVVKANGYGHGLVPVARAAREAGAEWLGVATIDEALDLRRAGDTGRILSWLGVPGESYAEAIAHDIELTAYSVAELDEIRAAAGIGGRPARLQLKVDTGLSRGGAAGRTGRPWSMPPEKVRRRGTGRSPASGPTSPAVTSQTIPRTTPRSGPSSRRSRSPPEPGCGPRSGTWPTRRPPSCARRPGSTSCAAASRRTVWILRPASRQTSGSSLR